MDIFDSRYFCINKSVNTCIGLWPYDTRKKYFIRAFWLLSAVALAGPQIMGIKANYLYSGKVMEHIAMVFFIGNGLSRMLTHILSENILKSTCNDIINNWSMIVDKSEKAILVEYSKRGRKMTIFYLVFMLLTYLAAVLPPMVPIILDIIDPLAEPRARVYIYHGQFLDKKKNNYFKIYLSDNFLIFLLSIVSISSDTMYAVCVEHCVGIFNIVKYRLQSINFLICDIDFSSKEDIFYNEVTQIVKLHQAALNFAQKLEASYSICFLMLTCSTIAMVPMACVTIISELGKPVDLLRHTMGLGCIGICQFYLCYPGQRLIDASGGIFVAIYCNEWYKCSAKTKKLLRFLMLRSMKPSLLTAGGFMAMNMENYLTITKTAMSYITVLASLR